VLDHRADHVGVVVLDRYAHRRGRGVIAGEARRQVVGVHVVSDDLGLDAEQPLEELQ
jgi:hypothetical protein